MSRPFIFWQLFAGGVLGSKPMKKKKTNYASNDKQFQSKSSSFMQLNKINLRSKGHWCECQVFFKEAACL